MSITQIGTTPVIRPASADDLPHIEALLTSSGLPTAGVEQSLDGFLVAEHDGALVGVVGLEHCCREYGLLRSTAVAPEWQGRGVGRRLVERAIAEAEARGTKALYLLTMTAERYFPSFGFETTTRDSVPAEVRATEEFCSACPASATVMSLALSGQAPSS
jgi:N-acetylglutamate synthase-like GNAT family acetyltransferase